MVIKFKSIETEISGPSVFNLEATKEDKKNVTFLCIASSEAEIASLLLFCNFPFKEYTITKTSITEVFKDSIFNN